MDNKIRLGIVGYGNLGKGVELAVHHNSDIVLKGIFTRRDVSKINSNSNVIPISDILNYKDEIDVMILCGGSAFDLPEQCPMIASHFNTVDSYDNHSNIPTYYEKIDEIAKKSNKVSIISAGWDPGLFSLNRMLAQSILPNGESYTFWGNGVSQGHSDAIRKIDGVVNAIQYTIPSSEAIEKVKSGEHPKLTNFEKHNRVCYVVPENFNDTKRIEKEIVSMPNYFKGYNTTVHFITEEEFKKNHSEMPHGGMVIRTGETENNHKHKIEFSLQLDNNPEFTSSVLLAFARGVYRMSKEGKSGAYTIFDIPLAYISPLSGEELRKNLL